MQSSRRKEPFRYQFAHPEICEFQLIEINGDSAASKFASGFLIDVNKSGCKLATELNMNANVNKLKVSIRTEIGDDKLQLNGEVRWQAGGEDGFRYGIRFQHDERSRERLMAELRRLAGEKRITAQ